MTTEYARQKLLKTADASRYLGVSTKTLRRYRDLEGGFLVQDKEWFDFQIAKKIIQDQQK